MSKVDILSAIIQFPGHIFAKIIIYTACVANSRCGEDRFIFDIFEKVKTLVKNPLWVFVYIHGLYDIGT